MLFQGVKILRPFLIMVISLAMLVLTADGSTAAASGHSSVWVPGDNLQGFFAEPGSGAEADKQIGSIGWVRKAWGITRCCHGCSVPKIKTPRITRINTDLQKNK